jgi:hypothetical protein
MRDRKQYIVLTILLVLLYSIIIVLVLLTSGCGLLMFFRTIIVSQYASSTGTIGKKVVTLAYREL